MSIFALTKIIGLKNDSETAPHNVFTQLRSVGKTSHDKHKPQLTLVKQA